MKVKHLIYSLVFLLCFTAFTSFASAETQNLQENSFLAFYEIDTYGGQSGSAMLNSSNQIIGVHNGGYDLNSNNVMDANGGPKMTKPMYDFVT